MSTRDKDVQDYVARSGATQDQDVRDYIERIAPEERVAMHRAMMAGALSPDFETFWRRAFPDLQKMIDAHPEPGPALSVRAELLTLRGLLARTRTGERETREALERVDSWLRALAASSVSVIPGKVQPTPREGFVHFTPDKPERAQKILDEIDQFERGLLVIFGEEP